MGQLGGITDSVLVGQLVSPDALSAVRVWQPVASVMFIIIGLMSAGAGFLSARGIGGQNYDKVNHVFNHYLYYVTGSSILMIVLMAVYTPQLIWYILPASSWLVLLVMAVMAYVVHRKNPLLNLPTKLHKNSEFLSFRE